MRVIITTITLILSYSILCAQDTTTWKLALINSLSNYRSNLLNIDQKDLKELIVTLDKWKKLEPDDQILNDFIFQAQDGYAVEKFLFKSISNHAKRKYPNSKLPHNFTEKELNSIARNSELADLIIWDIIERDYPFKIDSNPWFFKELEFYEIQKNEVIAEIGAGKGLFSFLISMTGKNPKIYINEVNNRLLSYIKNHFSNNNLQIDFEKIFLIEGSKKRINIPEKVDKIIIRNSLHHFSKKRKMLNSIKETLKENGTLLIYETLKNDKDITNCKHMLHDFELKSILKENGFILKKELKLDKAILLKYHKSNLIK